eukprot:TRINITY_DN33180_c0_g1_i1.p1 TRINITY_DN33180_c0_g1~~TRINITY_DN33180_c0_g1_i1.p1  ORF type:complete len:630 (+),score=113.82 TRINITY_DN33180_c0_g1_i1:115-2004(+)
MGCTASADVMPPPSAPPPAAAATPAGGDFGRLSVQVPFGAKPGSILQVQTPYKQKIQFPVPAGVAPGGTFEVQYPIPKNQAQLVDENALQSRSVAAHMLPTYWTNVRNAEISSFDQMIYVDPTSHGNFNDLFDQTYRGKATQDRKCPKVASPCARTPGGCPCVQPDGDPGMPSAYKVRRVIRVEDSDMWGRYVEKRDAIARLRGGEELPQLDPPVETDEVADRYSNTFEPLQNSLNEVYLWHGTNVRAALSIAQDDFRIDLAGSGAGTMYGRGAYFGENCTKADEYATDEPGGYYDGVFAMLLCRVCLGKYYLTLERDTEAGEKIASGNFDSTVGDRRKKADTFREFVLYDRDAVYPEYIVLYTRVHRRDDQDELDELLRKPLHMQLPIYWRNCHKDPGQEMFNDQILLRDYMVQLLQELVNACFKAEGSVKVQSVKRVENARVWQKYVAFRQKLTMQLGLSSVSRANLSRSKSAHFKPARELDDETGDVLTYAFLAQKESAEDCVSVSNLHEHLNEHLLWHGTTKEAAHKIATDDFEIRTGSQMKHAARFGNGAYLAEEVEKALCYADEADDGKRYVLLCRALCGDFFHTKARVLVSSLCRRLTRCILSSSWSSKLLAGLSQHPLECS